MNELDRMAKLNKKKQKGWGWFVHKNAGNVPYNNAVFNASASPSAGPSTSPVGSAMGENLEENDLSEGTFLKVATPYMLRNNGEILRCDNTTQIHPYIKYFADEPSDKELRYLLNEQPEFLLWFYKNTNNPAVKENIDILASTIVQNMSKWKPSKPIIDFLESNFDTSKNCSYEQLNNVYEKINKDTNQEFCRFRTSDNRLGGQSKYIYFRISSRDFNWFDLIWKVVSDNADFIEAVTVAVDEQVRPYDATYYEVDGQKVILMPVEEFLTLSGNPVFESEELSNLEATRLLRMENDY